MLSKQAANNLQYFHVLKEEIGIVKGITQDIYVPNINNLLKMYLFSSLPLENGNLNSISYLQ